MGDAVKRSLLVVALLLIAAGVPCVLWFVSGSREVEGEAARVVQQARDDAKANAGTAAGQLAARLEKLRATESQRPYFHYQNLMHDPRGASQGLSVVPSPLAQGPADPLILTHFQIDDQGRVTMPTLNDDVTELNAPDVARQIAISNTLRAAEPELLRSGAARLASLQAEVAARRTVSERQPPRVAAVTDVPPPAPAPSSQAVVTPAPQPAVASTTPPSPGLVAEPMKGDPWAALQQAPAVQVDRVNVGGRVTRTDQQNSGQQSVYIGKSQGEYSSSPLQNSLQSSPLQNSLQNTSRQNLQNNSQPSRTPAPAEPQAANGKPVLETKSPVQSAPAPVQPQQEQAVNVQKLDPGSFAQNAQSNIVYNNLKTSAARPKPKLPPRRAPDVEIATNDFAWSSIVVGGRPSLVALRPVVTPDAALLQGFVISETAVAEAVHGAGRLSSSTAGLPIGATGWTLDVDDRAAVVRAAAHAGEIRAGFQRTFFGGLAAVALAIIAVTILVWRSERLARERAQFAAAAAHELRTPLAGLRLYGDMLAHQLGDPERSRVYAQHVSEEADRLGRVVANMLEFTRLERGSLTVKREPGNLADAVRECVEQLRPALEMAGCQVIVSIAAGLPPVAFDRDAVHHIVQNLLDNAEKYSRPSTDRRVEIDLARVNGHALLTVSDRGVGVDPRTARHLFLPFERGSAGDAPAGLGLGLVLVKALAEAHGGDVSWQARSGGGTTFSVRLPAFYTP